MKKLVMLEYSFMFDPSEGWSSLSEFEKDIVKFFDNQGMDAMLVAPVSGQIGQRVMILSKKEPPKIMYKDTRSKVVDLNAARRGNGKSV
jgi:hypothetical protein